MKLVVFGLNFKTAPLDVRERLSFAQEDVTKSAEFFQEHKKNNYSGIVLSTCNRVEVYLSLPEIAEEGRVFQKFIRYVHKADTSDFDKHIYRHTGIDLIRHLYHVASGLDSMVLGENQILGQVKDAYYEAKSHGITDSSLNSLFESALRTGKIVRTTTDIGKFPVSISSIAVKQIESIYHDLSQKTVLVIGAGKMSGLTCENLYKHVATSIIVSSRTYENAKEIAEKYNGLAVPFDDFEEYLLKVDIVISQTASPYTVLTFDKMKVIMEKRNYRNMLIVDIAVPRDVEEECGKIPNLSLYNVDDLQAISNENRAKREKETKKCEKIIEEEAAAFDKSLKQNEMNDVLRMINEYKTHFKEKELGDIRSKFKSDENSKRINGIFNRMINKMLHPFLKSLRESEHNYEKMVEILISEFEALRTDDEQKDKDRHKEEQISNISG